MTTTEHLGQRATALMAKRNVTVAVRGDTTQHVARVPQYIPSQMLLGIRGPPVSNRTITSLSGRLTDLQIVWRNVRKALEGVVEEEL